MEIAVILLAFVTSNVFDAFPRCWNRLLHECAKNQGP